METLLHEIEATGQSLDEAQEQTQRLLKQLREKEVGIHLRTFYVT